MKSIKLLTKHTSLSGFHTWKQ